jgi:hypothetical protein
MHANSSHSLGAEVHMVLGNLKNVLTSICVTEASCGVLKGVTRSAALNFCRATV